jgi:hypothetical protein
MSKGGAYKRRYQGTACIIRLGSDKHSSLFAGCVNDDQKGFTEIPLMLQAGKPY